MGGGWWFVSWGGFVVGGGEMNDRAKSLMPHSLHEAIRLIMGDGEALHSYRRPLDSYPLESVCACCETHARPRTLLQDVFVRVFLDQPVRACVSHFLLGYTDCITERATDAPYEEIPA